MGTRVRVGDTEFELSFELSPEEPLPPGVEWLEDSVEEEENWPNGVPAELVAYARELAIAPDQAAHWVRFFTTHPQGQLAWQEIRPLWKPRRRKRKAKR